MKKTPGKLRQIVAANIRELQRRRKLSLHGAMRAGGPPIGRAANGKHGASLETLERIALSLNVEPWRLLLPDVDMRITPEAVKLTNLLSGLTERQRAKIMESIAEQVKANAEILSELAP